jgi:Ribbon-helix-helix protein, copG family
MPTMPGPLEAYLRAGVRYVWCQRWYHTCVEKTTIYLPEDLKAAVKRVARRRAVSEAEVIRESIRAAVGGARPRPRGALYSSSEKISRRVDELLDGFGER